MVLTVLGTAGLEQGYVDPEPIAVRSIEGALVIGPVLVLIAAGYRIGRGGADDETRWSIATWAALTVGALAAANRRSSRTAIRSAAESECDIEPDDASPSESSAIVQKRGASDTTHPGFLR